MTKSRPSLANSIRIVFASFFLCLFVALPAFATDGIYTKFGLDLGYADRIGYPNGGGLTMSNVLFNVTGSNSTFSISGDNTQINGELIAYKINLQSGVQVNPPKKKSKDKDN